MFEVAISASLPRPRPELDFLHRKGLTRAAAQTDKLPLEIVRCANLQHEILPGRASVPLESAANRHHELLAHKHRGLLRVARLDRGDTLRRRRGKRFQSPTHGSAGRRFRRRPTGRLHQQPPAMRLCWRTGSASVGSNCCFRGLIAVRFRSTNFPPSSFPLGIRGTLAAFGDDFAAAFKDHLLPNVGLQSHQAIR